MKSFAVIALLFAGASASVIRLDSGLPLFRSAVEFEPTLIKHIPITSFTQDIRGALLNQHQFSTGHGITVSDNVEALVGRGGMYEIEDGKLVQSDSSLVKAGSFSYTSPEGLPISLSYVADANGYRAEGAHLPRSVELPAEHALARAEALARVSALGSSYDASPVVLLKSSYDTPALVRVAEEGPIIIRSSGY